MKQQLNQLRKLFTPSEKRKFLFISVLLTISGALELAGIGLLSGAAALFIVPQNRYSQQLFDAVRQLFPQISYNHFVISAFIVIVVLMILKNIFTLGIIAFQSKVLRSAQNRMASQLFKQFLYSDYRSFITRSADEYSGVMERLNRTFDLYFHPVMQLLADAMTLLFMLTATLFFLPWQALLILGTLLAAAWGFAWLFQNLNRNLGQERHKQEQSENKLRLNVLLGMEQIRISGAEEFFLNRFRNLNAGICRRSANLYTLGQLPRLSLEVMALLVLTGVFVMLLSFFSKEAVLLTFTVIIAATARILPALSRFHYNLTLLKQSGALLDELSCELDNVRQELPVQTGTLPDCRGDITVKELSFSYIPGKPVIKNLSFTIPASKITGVSGRSGVGKTTLINLLAGLFTPEAGVICAGGVDISCNLPGWRSQLGYVPQNVFIFDGSVTENVTLSDQVDPARLKAALTAARLEEFAAFPEQQLNSRSGLSGGQKQRFGIARALYRQPPVLIFDEATSALDNNTENEILETLKKLRGKVTVIIISHRQDTLAICDNLIELRPL